MSKCFGSLFSRYRSLGVAGRFGQVDFFLTLTTTLGRAVSTLGRASCFVSGSIMCMMYASCAVLLIVWKPYRSPLVAYVVPFQYAALSTLVILQSLSVVAPAEIFQVVLLCCTALTVVINVFTVLRESQRRLVGVALPAFASLSESMAPDVIDGQLVAAALSSDVVGDEELPSFHLNLVADGAADERVSPPPPPPLAEDDVIVTSDDESDLIYQNAKAQQIRAEIVAMLRQSLIPISTTENFDEAKRH